MGNNPSNRDRWFFPVEGYSCDNPLSHKSILRDINLGYMFTRSQEIFEWDGLPDTIPQMELELLLQRNGFAIITKVDGELYAFRAGLGGELDAYYRPTVATVSNPYLNFSETLEIGKDCALIRNDPFNMGLFPLFDINAWQQAETDISLKWATINARIAAFLVANNEDAKSDAERVMREYVEGENLAVIGSQKWLDENNSAETLPFGDRTMGRIKELIEEKQYLKSQWFIDIGLNAAFNMKREAINESETQMGVDALLPLVRQMLKQRKLGAERVNRLYGTNWKPRLSETWKNAEEDAKRDGASADDAPSDDATSKNAEPEQKPDEGTPREDE